MLVGTAGFVEETAVAGAVEVPNDCSMGTTSVAVAVAAAIFGEAVVAGAALKSSVVMFVVLAAFALNFAARTVMELVATVFAVAGSCAIGYSGVLVAETANLEVMMLKEMNFY